MTSIISINKRKGYSNNMWLLGALGLSEWNLLKTGKINEMFLFISLQAVRPGAGSVKGKVTQLETCLWLTCSSLCNKMKKWKWNHASRQLCIKLFAGWIFPSRLFYVVLFWVYFTVIKGKPQDHPVYNQHCCFLHPRLAERRHCTMIKRSLLLFTDGFL